MRRAAKRDANHAEIVQRFEALGCTVADMAASGVGGFPDLVVGCVGRNFLVEIKNPESRYGRAGLSASQSVFDRDWRGDKVWTVTSTDEATVVVQNWRKRAA